MADLKQAQALLRVVRRDLTALHGMHDPTIFADEIFGFHVQQAVEKSLKAWLSVLGIAFPFTHDLSRLLVLIRDTGTDVKDLWWASEFTVFAQQVRYADGYLQADAPLDRKGILKRVGELFLLIDGMVRALESRDGV